MKRKFPPTSVRYCACCKDEKTFKYDRNIGHSRCIECGWHYIPTLDPTGMYQKEIEAFLKAKAEKQSSPEYQERKLQQNKIEEKKRNMYLLAFSKEVLEYRQRCKKRAETQVQKHKSLKYEE